MSVYVTTAMTAQYGERYSCGHPEHDPCCTTCLAWAEYDAIASKARASGLREAAEIHESNMRLLREQYNPLTAPSWVMDRIDFHKSCARSFEAKAVAYLHRADAVEKGGEMSGWIGVDLDGTLAMHGMGNDFPRAPVPLMLDRVKKWIADGLEVRIFTARVSVPEMREEQTRMIQDWCEKHGLPRLVVTNEKDFGMLQLWDDRAVRVEMNTGIVK